jgi:hypothetical protein
MRRAWVCIILLAIFGCNRRPTAPPPAKPSPAPGVEVTRVTPLPPDRPTHLAPTGTGQIFWVQETDGARETVFAISEGGVPTATHLSNATILEAMGKPAGRGSIQSLVVGADRNLYFYLAGRNAKDFIAAFGSFAPSTGKLQILQDTAALAQTSRMGASLALARGSIIRSDSLLWLWLRHDQGYALLSMDLTRPGSTLRQTFEAIRKPDGLLALTSPTEDLSSGPGKSLLFLDRQQQQLWKINLLGQAAPIARLADLPANITPSSLDDQGRAILLAPEPPAPSGTDDLERFHPLLNPSTAPAVAYPALVILDGDQRTLLDRNSFTVPLNFSVRAFAPTRLERDRSGWLAYDPRSGELLRLRIIER